VGGASERFSCFALVVDVEDSLGRGLSIHTQRGWISNERIGRTAQGL
jgi:hypothetical protein